MSQLDIPHAAPTEALMQNQGPLSPMDFAARSIGAISPIIAPLAVLGIGILGIKTILGHPPKIIKNLIE